MWTSSDLVPLQEFLDMNREIVSFVNKSAFVLEFDLDFNRRKCYNYGWDVEKIFLNGTVTIETRKDKIANDK